jgi:hypothetical protein
MSMRSLADISFVLVPIGNLSTCHYKSKLDESSEPLFFAVYSWLMMSMLKR